MFLLPNKKDNWYGSKNKLFKNLNLIYKQRTSCHYVIIFPMREKLNMFVHLIILFCSIKNLILFFIEIKINL